MKFAWRLLLVAASVLALRAQQVVAPTTAQVGSTRGDNVGDYNVTQSFELGYRFKSVGGNEGMYRSVVDYGNGVRLLGSNLTVNSKDGHGHYFDEILLTTLGLGNDNYQAVMLRIQKNSLYQYDMTWRLNAYYNPGLTIAGNSYLPMGDHLQDTIRRLQDHNLTLFPQSHIRFNLGYSRNTENGPALSTAQEFDANGPAFPVFTDVRRHWNEYRLGADVDFHGFKFRVSHYWDFFKDDTPYTSAGTFAAANPLDQTVLRQFNRSEPIHGSNPGWLGYLFSRQKLWGVNARLTYVSGHRDFALDETAAGTSQFGGAALRQIAVGGNANRPMLAGDLNLSVYPSDRLTIVNNTSITSNRIDGNSSYIEYQTGSLVANTIYFRYLGIRLVTNSTDLNYQLNSKIAVYGGYQYSDRLVRTIEGNVFPAFPGSFASFLYEVSNHINDGTVGVRIRPIKPLTINLDGEVGRASNPFTPISLKNYELLNGRVAYRVKKLQLSTTYRQFYNLNPPVSLSNYSSHSRQYTANAAWAPQSWFSLDASYVKLHLDTMDGLAFFASTGPRGQLQTSYSSIYRSNIHAPNLVARFNIGKRADIYVGYTLTMDTGDGRTSAVPPGTTDPIQALLSSVQTFPLAYQSPLARVSIRITPKVRWNAGYQFYNYHEEFGVLGIYQNFHANTGFTSVLWSF